jgi:uncharacterized protein YndB with AHSA1/START domain
MKTRISVPEGVPFIDIEREFDAPAELVHRAFLEPDLIVQWLGPRKYRMTLDKWDARPGGAYRYVHGNEEGEYAFHGVFHSTDIDNLVQTFEFEGWPGRVALDRIVIEDLGNGRSRVRGHSVYQAVADRDAMAESGMAEGVDDGYNRLDELLAKIGQPVAASR